MQTSILLFFAGACWRHCVTVNILSFSDTTGGPSWRGAPAVSREAVPILGAIPVGQSAGVVGVNQTVQPHAFSTGRFVVGIHHTVETLCRFKGEATASHQ